MPLDPQKLKEMQAVIKRDIGITPREALNASRPPIQERVAQLRQPTKPSLAPREVFGEMGQDIKQTGQGIKEDINKRLDTVTEIQGSNVSGVRKATQVFGQGLGAVQDVVGQGFKGLAKVMLAPEQEQQVKEGVGKVAQKVVQTKPVQSLISGYAELEKNNPSAARDVDTVLNTLMTVLDVAGAGSASAIENAGKEAIETGLKTAGKTAAKVAKSPLKLASDVGGGLIGKTDRYVNSAVTKALNLTQGDVKNIALSTTNEPGLWVASKNLIRGNVDETKQAIKELGDVSYKQVRDEIGKVTTQYNKIDTPRYQDALTQIIKQTDGVVGLESVTNEAKALLGKDVISLGDVQRVKELMDDVFSLYKATGDVSETTAKEGLANVRKDIKEFIETEVQKNTGVDIRPINNDVATARSLEDAITTRSTRGLTRANIGLYDLGAFGAGSVVGGPAVGLIAVITKKLIQNPAVGLRFAKWLDKLSDAKRAKLKAEFEAGNIPDEAEKVLSDVLPPAEVRRIEKDLSLTGDNARVQDASIAKYESNPGKLVDEYIEANGKIVNTDEARKLFKTEGYKGSNSAAVQEASSAVAKDAWKYLLKTSKGNDSVIYAGGSGTGKTSAVKNIFPDELADAGAILDGNLSTIKSAQARIKESLEAGKYPTIIYVYRDPVDAWVNGVIKRMNNNADEGGRIVPLSVFTENHKGSYGVVKSLLDSPDLGKNFDVKMVDNSLGRNNQTLLEQSKFDKIKYPDNLKNELLRVTKELYEKGEVTKTQYEALIK